MSYCLTCMSRAARLGPAILIALAIFPDFLQPHGINDTEVLGLRLKKSGKSSAT